MIYVLDSTFCILNLHISMNTFSSSPDVSLHASPSQMTNAGPLGVNPHIPKSLVISPAKSGVVGTAPVQVVRSEPKFPESAPTIPPSP
ncbi:Alpha-glucosidase [Fusarium oxysporum f. sp. albedinis]|nr:Alpha-glucosidase [Fusarium oxysporum f. sp. albedinis]